MNLNPFIKLWAHGAPWVAVVAAALLVAGCSTTDSREPIVRPVATNVQVPVPCPALSALGPEPEYPDTDKALKAAKGSPALLAALYVKGRLLRVQRLAEYVAAKEGCDF